AIDLGLVSLETFALFSFECFDGDRTKFDPSNGPPWIRIALENLDSVETRVLKCCEELAFRQRTGNAAAPKLRIVLHFFRHFFIAHDVGDHGTPTLLSHTENFIEQLWL